MQICCRWAPSLGELEATHQEIWGTKDYVYSEDRDKPTVFFGLYDLRDYFSLWRHRGKKWILWAGSDISNFVQGFVFNDGKLRLISKTFRGNWWVKLILKKAEHWVENDREAQALRRQGVKVTGICPSFLGDINKFKVNYFQKKPANVYISCGKNRQLEYGFGIVERIASKLPNIIFHLYGDSWKTENKNVIVHGRVPKEQMNREIENMQLGLRLNEFDGFSEITAKAILMGHYVITKVPYQFLPRFNNDEELISLLNSLTRTYKPNPARDYFIKIVNNYPWREESKV